MKPYQFFLAIFAILVISTVTNVSTLAQSGNEPTLIPDRYIVIFKNDIFSEGVTAAGETPAELAERLAATYRGSLHFVYDSDPFGFAATFAPEAVLKVQAQPEVAYLEADQKTPLIPQPALPEMDALADQTGPVWNLDRIDQRDLPLNQLYRYQTTGAGVHVYVIDTGIRASHTEFATPLGGGYDFVDNDDNPDDCNGHGTHVAGTVGGSSYGVAKAVTLHAVRVLDCDGSGSTSGVIAGINWVKENHQRPAVINMSLGGGYSQSLNDAVAAAHAAGVTVVVAAGNENSDACYVSPAAAPEALTIGATGSSDTRASFSNYGSCLDLFAPGVSIKAAYIGSDYATGTLSGTSMASPHVAGAAALYLETNPTASPAVVAEALLNLTSPDKLSSIGTGSPNRLLYMGDIQNQPLTVAPESQTICRGAEAAYTVTANNGASFPISLAVEGGPAQATFNFSRNPLPEPASASLTVSNTGLANPGQYSLEILGATAAGTVSARTNLVLVDTPATVSPLLPVSGATGIGLSPTLQWAAETGATGYDLQLATSPSFANPLYSAVAETNQHTITERLAPLSTYYWRVRAKNPCGAGAFSTAAYFTTAPAPSVLLVDDDDNDPNVRSYYTEALDALGISYDIFDTAQRHSDPAAGELAYYQSIIWFTGFKYDSSTGPNESGEAALKSYFTEYIDRCFFISSQDYLWAQGIDLDTPNQFMKEYLGAASGVSDTGESAAQGVNDFADLGPYILDYPFTDYSDQITADDTADVAFIGSTEASIGLSKIAPTYRAMWWGFPFEAIPSATQRQTAMGQILEWCVETANQPPTDISLSSSQVAENLPPGAPVGDLTTTDPDGGDTHAYTLVTGSGDADNSRFIIEGSSLKTAQLFDFESQAAYSIRIQSNDGQGGIFAKAFTITVNNIIEAPVTQADSAVTIAGQPVIIDPLANDYDPDGEPFSLSGFTQATYGTVATAGAGQLSYTPRSGFSGEDSFTYTVSDGVETATGTITVTTINVDALVTLQPAQQTELTVTDASLTIPAGAVAEPLYLSFTELEHLAHALPAQAEAAARNFVIAAYRDGVLQPGFTFDRPITIVLQYDLTATKTTATETLQLVYWHETNHTWQTDGITQVAHDTNNRQLTYTLSHSAEFALFVQSPLEQQQVFIPIVIR